MPDSTFTIDNTAVALAQAADKGVANGYAALNGSGVVPIAQLASGTPDGTKFVRDDNTLAVPPGTGGGALGGCAVYRTTATGNITTAVVTAIAFDNEEFDNSGYHDNSTNPSRLTIPATGIYLVTGSAMWDSNATGARGLWVQLNGTDTATNRKGGQYRSGLAGSDMEDVSLVLALSSGDYIELMAFQTSGNNRTIVVTASRPRFAIYRLA